MQHFSLTVFAKLPVVSLTHMRHMKNMLISRIILSVWQFRIARRYAAANAPFVKIELDISDSGREGCAVSTLAIKAEPRDWEGAVGVAVQEMRRLQRFGITKGELSRYLNAILRDSEQLARQVDKIPSLDTLNFVMESLACGHSVMSHVEAHEAMEKVAHTVTLEEVNQMARSVLAFGSDYGNEAGPLADAAQHPHRYSGLGPVRATSVVACLPAYTMESGLSVSTTLASAHRKAPTGASAHIDADKVDLAELEAQSKQMDEIEIPEGAIKFDLSPTEIARVLSDLSHEVEPEEDIDCPEHLIPPQVMDAKVAALQPAFVPLEGPGGQGPCLPDPDPHSGVVQRRLQNGVRVNYKHTDNEPQSALMRLIVPGGRAAESMEKGPEGFGAVLVGTRALSESGGVGPWPREQVEVFCIANLINTALEADEENIVKDFHCSVSQGSLTATFELAHLFLTEPVWEEEAFRRAKAAWISNSQGIDKSLEGGTHERVMKAMMGAGKERRSRDPTEEEIEALDFERVKQRVTRLLHAGALEINIVGDVDAAELDRHLLRFIGTVPTPDPAQVQPFPHVTIPLQDLPFEARHSAWHLKDSDQRACAYIAGAAPARWGPMGNFDPLPPYPLSFDPPPMTLPLGASPQQRQAATEARRRHPLFTSCVLMLLTEVINSRLFTTVRDSLGLTYDVSFEVTMFDIIRAGWFTVKVTSHPDKIYDALDASAAVLRDVTVSSINKRELDRARTTVLTRHESDMKDNVYWLGMVTHCQNPAVPWKSVRCLRDLKAMYVSLTVEDMYFAYSQLQLDDEHLYSCVGVSGKSTVQPPEERLVGGIGSSRREEWQEEAPGPLGGTMQGPSLAALFTAMTAALGVTNLKSAMEKMQPSKGPEGGR
ncbi:peptidase M16 inactive domain-containing protein [Haematococcus lacustris]